MSSAAESELGALFVTTKEMIPLLQTLLEMGWPQPLSPIKTDNSTTVSVVNKTNPPRKKNYGHALPLATLLRFPREVLILLGPMINKLG